MLGHDSHVIACCSFWVCENLQHIQDPPTTPLHMHRIWEEPSAMQVGSAAEGNEAPAAGMP